MMEKKKWRKLIKLLNSNRERKIFLWYFGYDIQEILLSSRALFIFIAHLSWFHSYLTKAGEEEWRKLKDVLWLILHRLLSDYSMLNRRYRSTMPILFTIFHNKQLFFKSSISSYEETQDTFYWRNEYKTLCSWMENISRIFYPRVHKHTIYEKILKRIFSCICSKYLIKNKFCIVNLVQ